MTYKYTLPQIAALLADRMDALIGELGLAGTGHLEKDEWVCLNPTRADRHTGSFRIRVRGPKRGSWREYAGDVHGDALELIAYVSGVGKAEAVRRARAFLGLDGASAPPPPVVFKKKREDFADSAHDFEAFWADKENDKYRLLAQALFLRGEKGSLRGTPVDGYLVGRGINLALLGKSPGAIRYAQRLKYKNDVTGEEMYLPAMIGLIQGPDGRPRCVHRTYLANVGGNWVKNPDIPRAKKVSGPYGGGFIPIWRGASNVPFAKIEKPERVYVTEGIEDALSVALAVPEYRVISAVSVGNVKNILFPAAVREIVVVADNDAFGSPAERQVEKTVEALEARGHAVFIARSKVGKDFNDWLKKGQNK